VENVLGRDDPMRVCYLYTCLLYTEQRLEARCPLNSTSTLTLPMLLAFVPVMLDHLVLQRSIARLPRFCTTHVAPVLPVAARLALITSFNYVMRLGT
jgi:hypothetical protein